MHRVQLDGARQALVDDILAMMTQMRTLLVDFVGPISLPTDLTMQQLRVLLTITRAPGITTHELSQRLAVSAPTVSGLVDRLAEKGLIERATDPADRRIRRLSINATGRELVESLDTALDQLIGLMQPLMSTDDLEVVRHASQVLLATIERAKADAACPASA